ncbi:hypothetical protein OROHE_021297 [Orobanche hederae]
MVRENYKVPTWVPKIGVCIVMYMVRENYKVCHLRTRNGDFRTLADEEVAEHLADIGF